MTEKSFPQLYELSTTGKIKVWSIKAVDNGATSDVVTSFGAKDGKLQVTSDTIKEGKNIGKANETSVFQQACAEAQSKWEKKKKSGYVETLKAAKAGEVDAIITGGIEPMLAHSYSKSGDKIVFPAFIQPKLDGMRCIAIKKGEDVTLWTRTRKPITSCPHIIEAIKAQFYGDIILDGELYNHALKSDFEKIITAVKRTEPTEESKLIQYHIYDVIEDREFHKRTMKIGHLKSPLVEVDTLFIDDEIEMMKEFVEFVEQGYEGLMIRNQNSMYVNKRSYDLQKVKEFDDAEFLIVGVKEGRGKLQGTLGAFLCQTDDGTQFEVKMTGNQEDNAKYLNDESSWKDKYLTVKYQGMTTKSSVPRFPIGLRIKLEE